MNKIEVLSRPLADGTGLAQRPRRDTAPQAIKLLLPLWGFRYVQQFLEYSLPSLLAPGNIPALAAALPTEFVILTSADDEDFIKAHPCFKRLADTCATDIRLIDHLITDGNYSTTITLAYTEALRTSGAAMLDTCFFILVSDYVMADGSLANVLKRMLSGASAVLAGNFQVVREDAATWLQDRPARGREVFTLPPRELMRWALNFLHPATLANTVNISINHNSHTNRLFWFVGGSTIIGRFYLIHPLCIRPEVTDFAIGSSFDYSFIPELCPSGNVESIEDSDEYLVIEMQPRDHEGALLRPGPIARHALAKSLNQWATSAHRANARRTVVFHAGELPAQLNTKIKEADAFIADIDRRLNRKPLPYRGHPYWRGAIAAFYNATGRRLNDEEWRLAMDSEAALKQWLRFHVKYMGRPPHVALWHPSWPDFRIVLKELASFYADRSQRLLMVSSEATPLSVALKHSGERVHQWLCMSLLQRPAERYLRLRGTFDLCLLELYESDLKFADRLIDRIVPLMKDGAGILVVVSNRRSVDRVNEYRQTVMGAYPRFVRAGALPKEIQLVPMNRLRRWVRRGIPVVRRLMSQGAWIGVSAGVIGGGALFPLSFLGNLGALRGTRHLAPNAYASSFIMSLTVNAPKTSDVVGHLAREVASEKRRESVSRVAGVLSYSQFGGTREPQYNRCLELRDTIGLASLGLMTNQIWYDDPRRLAFVLARYKFVSRMLSGCRNVGEVGCGDAFGTRIVMQEVQDVTVYDFDPVFIEDIRMRQDERWPLKAEVHDIVEAPLPRRHQALFSLDVLEHIAPEHEHAFVRNMCASLPDNGLLVIGTPSLESQSYASQPSIAGHVNCKSGNELKTFLSDYFRNVFILSMNDEVVHTGFSPMAHYLFAICNDPKSNSGAGDDNLRRIGADRPTSY